MTVMQPPNVVKLSMADNASLTGAFWMGDWVFATVAVPTGWVAANIGFYVCDTSDGTFTILRDDSTDAPVQIANVSTSAAKTYVFPTKTAGCHWVKLWAKSATAATETDVSQTGGPLAFTVTLK